MVSSLRGKLKKAKKTAKKKIKSHVKVPEIRRKPGGSTPFVPNPDGSRPIEKPSMTSVKKAKKNLDKKKSAAAKKG